MIIKLGYKFVHTIRNFAYRVFGIKTMGSRALVVHDDQVLLVKHTYRRGWYTIGGKVERGESPLQAILRELLEEVGLIPLDEPDLFSVYHSYFEKRDDYIAFYIVRNFTLTDVCSPEIAEKKWFSFDALPIDITPATTRRIEEFLGKRKVSGIW